MIRHSNRINYAGSRWRLGRVDGEAAAFWLPVGLSIPTLPPEIPFNGAFITAILEETPLPESDSACPMPAAAIAVTRKRRAAVRSVARRDRVYISRGGNITMKDVARGGNLYIDGLSRY